MKLKIIQLKKTKKKLSHLRLTCQTRNSSHKTGITIKSGLGLARPHEMGLLGMRLKSIHAG
jgi:hypothetical protein